MHATSGRLRRPSITFALVLAIVLALSGSAPAFAAPDITPPWPTLPGEPDASRWPANHSAASDPVPGDAAYIAPFATAAPPPDGMSDDQLSALDPAAYAEILPERDVIEAALITQVHEALASAGVTPDKNVTMSEEDARAASAALATSATSPYGYLKFTLTPNTTNAYARNGYLGTLYFIYGLYNARIDAYKWYTVSWPARSGNNKPSSQSVIGVGPIPARTWDFGFASSSWRGYEPDGRVEFSPGKWRLDPWTGGPFGRSYMEVHGGVGSHTFGATKGCIRVYPAALSSLKTYYDTKMANKRSPASAHLNVKY